MSKKTERLAEKARVAAENAEKEQQVLRDKLAAAEAAEREEASKSPADKAMERAFARGTLPEADRRAPEGHFIPDGGSKARASEPAAGVVATEIIPEPPFAVVVDGVVSEAPPTGVRSPATLEVDLNARRGVDVAPATRIPPLVPAEPLFPNAPGIPQSSETRGPLVALDRTPLDQSHPSTVEAAVALQHIPNDQIHAVFEDAGGVKRDALGHIIDRDPPRVVPRTTGKGFE